MTALVISITLIIGFIGISTVVWSFINTRNKSYEDYNTRKRSK
jgi:nitrogen fixation-related uncharacterized protein